MKKLVAYSSVSHLGFVVLGIFSFTQMGLDGAVYQMLNHGISTGALFLLVGMLYERRHSLEIADYGGVATAAPWLVDGVPDHHAGQHRPAAAEQFRRRVPGAAGHRLGQLHLDRLGGHRRDPLRLLHAVAVPARVLRRGRRRGAARTSPTSTAARVGRRDSADGHDGLDGRLLDSIAPLGEKNMPGFDTAQIDKRGLNNDQFVGVTSMADDIFSWYVGNVSSDVYFCPERQGNYFGSFYMKDAPAMGVADYYIDTSRSQDGGVEFLSELNSTQLGLISSLTDTQVNLMNAIVTERTIIDTLLRASLSGRPVDTAQVLAHSEIYGKLDGLISYYYATNFSKVNWTLSTVQMDSMIVFRNLPQYACVGAYLYSDSIGMPVIENTDFLFAKATTGVKQVNNVANLSCYPNPFTNKICLKNSSGSENYELMNITGQTMWNGKLIEQQDFSALSKGIYFLKVNSENSTQVFKLIKK